MAIRIETPRLLIREFTLQDSPRMWEIQRDPEVARFTGESDQMTVADIHAIHRDIVIPEYERHGYGRWAVVHKEDDILIGFAGLKYIPAREQTDLGYRLAQQYWGQGLATEACRAIVAYAWEPLGLLQLIATVMPANHASVRVLEKLGFDYVEEQEDEGDLVSLFVLGSPNCPIKQCAGLGAPVT